VIAKEIGRHGKPPRSYPFSVAKLYRTVSAGETKVAISIPSLVPRFLILWAAKMAAAEPAPLADSRKAYQRALTAAVAPLKTRYLARLIELLRQHTKSGDLIAALVVQEEIRALWCGAPR